MPHRPVTDTTTSLGAIPYVHTDPNGHRWQLTVHWVDIHGKATPVGLDIRGLADSHADLSGATLGASVLRSIRIGEVIETTRRNGTWAVPAGTPNTGDHPESAHQARAARTDAKQTKGPGRPAEQDDDFIAEVATLFRRAKAQGGEPARKPWRYVAEQLNIRGVRNVTDGQLKNWSRRAKNLGLLSTREKE